MPERLEEPVKVRAGRLGAEATMKSAERRSAPQLSEEVRETAGARRASIDRSIDPELVLLDGSIDL